MPWLSNLARTRKLSWFFKEVPREARILEIGCGDGWLGRALRARGFSNYAGLDLVPPADFVGDIREWRSLGIAGGSFDVVVAFELVEHVPCFKELHDILVPGGLLMLTSPLPRMDWVMRGLERMGFNQPRTSPHCHLVYFKEIPYFEPLVIRRPAGLAQWGIFRRPME